MKKPTSEYCWKFEWTPGPHIWRMSWRETGQILGRVLRCDLDDGSTAHEGLVWTGEKWISVGHYDHWTKAKKAVQAAHVGIRLHQAARS